MMARSAKNIETNRVFAGCATKPRPGWSIITGRISVMHSELSRRTAFRFAFGAACAFVCEPAVFAASDFWNRKQPSEWTTDEIHRLMSKSPWAKEVNAGVQPDPKSLTGAPPSPDVPGGGPGRGMGGPGGYGGGYNVGYGRERRERGARATTAVTIRWESAQPILEATKEKLPPQFNGHYVLMVAGLPLEWGLEGAGRGSRNPEDASVRLSDLVERLQAGAALGAKGKDPEGAGIVRRAPSDEGWLFGFSRELLPLTRADKDIEFSLNSGPMVVKAKFEPAEMMYRGQLAL